MYRIAICDDDCVFRNSLVKLTKEYFKNEESRAVIKSFADGEEIMPLYNCGSRPFDVLLLDGLMRNMDGYKLSENIRKVDPSVIIVFISSFSEYAEKGYVVDVYRFIHKDSRHLKDNLFNVLDDVIKELEKNARRFSLKCGHDLVCFKVSDVFCIEVLNRMITIHSKQKIEAFSGNLAEIAETVIPYGFARCHRSYLVNISQIKRIKSESLLLTNGEEIPLGRAYKNALSDIFTRYLGGMI